MHLRGMPQAVSHGVMALRMQPVHHFVQRQVHAIAQLAQVRSALTQVHLAGQM